MEPNRSTSSTSTAHIRRILIFGAVVLLAGVLTFCHGEISRSGFMVEVQSAWPKTESEFTEQYYNRISETLNAIDHEQWLSLQWLIPIGIGSVAASLLFLAIMTRSRFSMRTLLLAVLYVTVLIGVPFGFVRPQLQNPRIWIRPGNPDIAFGQLRLWPEANSKGNPWASTGPTTRFEFSLANRDSLLMALAAFFAALLLAFLSLPKRKSSGLTVAHRSP